MRVFKSLCTGVVSVLISGGVTADSFVLVHGAFQDASGWDEVIPVIEDAGHTVVAVNLPGRDAIGDAAKRFSLQSYIETVISVVESSDAPVHLVGHSFGGMTISGVAEAIPEKIATLVYVAAYMPEDGESMEKLAYSDTDNGFTQETFIVAKDYSHASLLPADQARVFINDGNPDQKKTLEASMIREPLAPIGMAVSLTDVNFGSVKKAYIRTTQDQTVSTPLQTRMIDRAKLTLVRDIDTGHAPYITAPTELAETMLAIVK